MKALVISAPEVIGYDPLSLATDMWSIGVITYILWVQTNHVRPNLQWIEALNYINAFDGNWKLIISIVSLTFVYELNSSILSLGIREN